jgi:hypothetical protein
LPREDSKRKTVAIIIRNTGGSDALHFHIKDIQVFQSRVRFSAQISLVAAGKASKPIKPHVVEFPDSKSWDIASAMLEGSSNVHGSRTNQAYDYQGSATFYDTDGIKYDARWIYTFYPFRFMQTELNPDDETTEEEREEIGPYLTVSDVEISKSIA